MENVWLVLSKVQFEDAECVWGLLRTTQNAQMGKKTRYILQAQRA